MFGSASECLGLPRWHSGKRIHSSISGLEIPKGQRRIVELQSDACKVSDLRDCV